MIKQFSFDFVCISGIKYYSADCNWNFDTMLLRIEGSKQKSKRRRISCETAMHGKEIETNILLKCYAEKRHKCMEALIFLHNLKNMKRCFGAAIWLYANDKVFIEKDVGFLIWYGVPLSS